MFQKRFRHFLAWLTEFRKHHVLPFSRVCSRCFVLFTKPHRNLKHINSKSSNIRAERLTIFTLCYYSPILKCLFHLVTVLALRIFQIGQVQILSWQMSWCLGVISLQKRKLKQNDTFLCQLIIKYFMRSWVLSLLIPYF